MARHVILMRHGESEANARHIWQGAGSTPITAVGRRQAGQAGERLAGRRLALVESSDLERSVDTARIAGFEPRQRSLWREGAIGEWEGLDGDSMMERYADDLERLHHDYDMRMGMTGESPRQVADRGWEALHDVADRLDDGQTALVVAHGGLIGAVLWRLLGRPTGTRRLGMLSNTSFSEVTFGETGPAIRRYNDAAHLGPVTGWTEFLLGEGAVAIDLIRHGVTLSNLEGRVQGQSDGVLHPNGRGEARRLGKWIGEVDESYSSSLGRAMATAEIAFGRRPIPVDDLMEISMGEWEGELWHELDAAGRFDGYPRTGYDTRRGVTGETWGEVRERVAGFLETLRLTHAGRRVAATSHGGAIKAYVGGILGFGFGKATVLGPLGNTSVTQVVIPADGMPMLATYNVMIHLEL